jgi:hypothetical protein
MKLLPLAPTRLERYAVKLLQRNNNPTVILRALAPM